MRAGGCLDPDDVAFLEQVVNKVRADAGRVVGVVAGGGMRLIEER